MGGPDSQNQTSHHPELRGCNQRLMGGLSNHLELNGWSLGTDRALLIVEPELHCHFNSEEGALD